MKFRDLIENSNFEKVTKIGKNKVYYVSKKQLKNIYIEDFKDGDIIVQGDYTIHVDRKGYDHPSLGTKVSKNMIDLNSTPGVRGGLPYFIDDFIGKRRNE